MSGGEAVQPGAEGPASLHRRWWRRGRGWRRAAALTAVAFATSVVAPAVLVAVPFLVLVGLGGMRGRGTFLLSVLAMVVVVFGARDGLWYVERAWALVAGGTFAALSLGVPGWRLTSRALASIAVSAVAFTALIAVRADAWASLDWSVAGEVQARFQDSIDGMLIMRGGEPLDASAASAMVWLTELTVRLFPANVALVTMAGLGVAWWLWVRLVLGEDNGLAPLSRFGFNDHLVWLMITGLVLVTGWAGDGIGRVGANLAAFMAALYALRGFAVGLAVSGGVSFFGYSMLLLGILLAAPVVLGFAVVLGVADTWLDLRTRAASIAG